MESLNYYNVNHSHNMHSLQMQKNTNELLDDGWTLQEINKLRAKIRTALVFSLGALFGALAASVPVLIYSDCAVY